MCERNPFGKRMETKRIRLIVTACPPSTPIQRLCVLVRVRICVCVLTFRCKALTWSVSIVALRLRAWTFRFGFCSGDVDLCVEPSSSSSTACGGFPEVMAKEPRDAPGSSTGRAYTIIELFIPPGLEFKAAEGASEGERCLSRWRSPFFRLPLREDEREGEPFEFSQFVPGGCGCCCCACTGSDSLFRRRRRECSLGRGLFASGCRRSSAEDSGVRKPECALCSDRGSCKLEDDEEEEEEETTGGRWRR